MFFHRTELMDAVLIELDRREDRRGFFARTWDQQLFKEHGLVDRVVQANLSYNHTSGTLRGMHYQKAPYAETKLVRCVRGAIFDVIIDIRPDSPTYKRWIGVELTAENRRALYVPEGFAHGFQTLTDDCEIMYQVSQVYTPGAEGGIRYNDPSFGIQWPLPVSVISEKDAAWPDFAG
ncbi:MAG: dTDP-4-dehydrorhamnose 3,5-epimerase [Chloroflexi bacterium OHK40]